MTTVSASGYTLSVGDHPPGPNARLHPLARYRLCRPLTEAVAWQARALHQGPPWERARVEVVFVHRSRRYLNDPDNLVARVKCLIDGLKGVTIADDGPAHLELIVRQETGPRREVRLYLTPLA